MAQYTTIFEMVFVGCAERTKTVRFEEQFVYFLLASSKLLKFCMVRSTQLKGATCRSLVYFKFFNGALSAPYEFSSKGNNNLMT
jgi:hypothetical protein